MKNYFTKSILSTIILLFLTTIMLSGQSKIIKVGGVYRNTNYIGSQDWKDIGPQLGFNYKVIDDITLAINIGNISSKWNQKIGQIFLFTNKDRTTYLEAAVLFPILRRWIPSGNLTCGPVYIGSRNTFKYLELALIRDNKLESMTTNVLEYNLHEGGLMLEYIQPISNHFVFYLNTGLSASINRAPSNEVKIIEYTQFSTGIGTATYDETRKAHYRISAGVGYRF